MEKHHRRSPKFRYGERVRVVACTGREVEEGGDPVDAAALVGGEGVVMEAVPNPERDGWLIGISTDRWTTYFAEDSLKRTGYGWNREPSDFAEYVPLKDARLKKWKDNITVTLTLDWYLKGKDATKKEDRRVEAALKSAARSLRELVPTKKKVGGTSVVDASEPMEITLWLYPSGDALEAYERIVAQPSRAWMHGENDKGFLESLWQRPITEAVDFLIPGVDEARVTCEYYSSPGPPVRRQA
jgi:hypothetical protein